MISNHTTDIPTAELIPYDYGREVNEKMRSLGWAKHQYDYFLDWMHQEKPIDELVYLVLFFAPKEWIVSEADAIGIDGLLKDEVESMLEDHHPNEIASLIGTTDQNAKKIIRQIYFDWGFTKPEDWTVMPVDDHYVIFAGQIGAEWIDEDGEFRCFDTEQEALTHLNESLNGSASDA